MPHSCAALYYLYREENYCKNCRKCSTKKINKIVCNYLKTAMVYSGSVAMLFPFGKLTANRAFVFNLKKRAEEAIKYSAQKGAKHDNNNLVIFNKSEQVGKYSH